MDNKPLDVPSEVAAAARLALDTVVLHPAAKAHFVKQFVIAASADNMARPERPEDVEHFSELAADQLLADRGLRDTLVCLIRAGVTKYMEPA